MTLPDKIKILNCRRILSPMVLNQTKSIVAATDQNSTNSDYWFYKTHKLNTKKKTK